MALFSRFKSLGFVLRVWWAWKTLAGKLITILMLFIHLWIILFSQHCYFYWWRCFEGSTFVDWWKKKHTTFFFIFLNTCSSSVDLSFFSCSSDGTSSGPTPLNSLVSVSVNMTDRSSHKSLSLLLPSAYLEANHSRRAEQRYWYCTILIFWVFQSSFLKLPYLFLQISLHVGKGQLL